MRIKKNLMCIVFLLLTFIVGLILTSNMKITQNTRAKVNTNKKIVKYKLKNSIRKVTTNINDNKVSENQYNNKFKYIAPMDVKIPVLLYHHLSLNQGMMAPTSVITPKRFEEQIRCLKKNGYNSVNFKQLYDFCTNGVRLPIKPFVITFDDGYLSNYELAYPILKKYDVKATIFIVTDWTTRSPKTIPHFNWQQAKEMEKSGLIDIGNHTCSHIDCKLASTKKIIYEVSKAEKDIESNLGKRKILSFAYPAYSATPATINLLSKMGYKIQIIGLNGVINKKSSLVNIKRLLMSNDYTGMGVVSIIKWWEKR